MDWLNLNGLTTKLQVMGGLVDNESEDLRHFGEEAAYRGMEFAGLQLRVVGWAHTITERGHKEFFLGDWIDPKKECGESWHGTTPGALL